MIGRLTEQGELMGQGTETAISAPLLKGSELLPEFHASALRELADILAIDLNDIPLVFHPAQPKALKIGVDGDITNRFPSVDAAKLGGWLRRWCGSSQYLTQLRDGLGRYDLDGHDAGEIPASQREHAAGRLARRIKRSRAKKGLLNKLSGPMATALPGKGAR
jgi:sRNA-binding protein